jgi:hypothetical protein
MLEQEANFGEFIMKRFFVLAGLIYLQTGNLLSSDIEWGSDAEREAYERVFAKRQEERIAKYKADCQKLEEHVTNCIKENNYKGLFLLSAFNYRDKFDPPEFGPYMKTIELVELDNNLSDDEIKNMENTVTTCIRNIISSTNITGIIKIDFRNYDCEWYTLWSCDRSISFACS